jgi:hypothetical protein
MATVVQAPLEMVEAVASLRLPPRADQRLQVLMDRNTNGALTPTEREELETLVELSETLALVRAKALHLLGRKPLTLWPVPLAHWRDNPLHMLGTTRSGGGK